MLSLTGCVISSKLPNLSKPPFHDWKIGRATSLPHTAVPAVATEGPGQAPYLTGARPPPKHPLLWRRVCEPLANISPCAPKLSRLTLCSLHSKDDVPILYSKPFVKQRFRRVGNSASSNAHSSTGHATVPLNWPMWKPASLAALLSSLLMALTCEMLTTMHHGQLLSLSLSPPQPSAPVKWGHLCWGSPHSSFRSALPCEVWDGLISILFGQGWTSAWAWVWLCEWLYTQFPAAQGWLFYSRFCSIFISPTLWEEAQQVQVVICTFRFLKDIKVRERWWITHSEHCRESKSQWPPIYHWIRKHLKLP